MEDHRRRGALHLLHPRALGSLRACTPAARVEELCRRYRGVVPVGPEDHMAVLGVDVVFRSDGLAAPLMPSLLRCVDSGRPLTFAEVASRYRRVYIAPAHQRPAGSLRALREAGVDVVVVLTECDASRTALGDVARRLVLAPTVGARYRAPLCTGRVANVGRGPAPA